ncbi:MAG: transposase [Clostridia bacterium]|nr:transposase [Clostridia bacterium]
MSRTSRKNLKANYFHIMVQGVNKEYIFNTDKYMRKYHELIFFNLKKCNVNLLAYCIMNNHAHLLIYTENIEQMSKFMKSVDTAFSMYYNQNQNRVGVVFRNRFESETIKDRKHLINCIAYIHNNPVKVAMVVHPSEYKYSSYNSYIDGTIGEQIINLTFGSKENCIKIFDEIHKNYNNGDFIDYIENIDYNKKLKELIDIDMKGMQLSKKMPHKFVKKLYFEESIPISKLCKFFNLSRYEVYKIIK